MAEQRPTLINGKGTWISLQLVVQIVAVVLAVVLGWQDLKSDIRLLRRDMQDRWTKTDDELHMTRFAKQNGLEEVEHERSGQ